MTKKPEFVPTEEQIQRVLKQSGGDPRKLAIAYLKAQNRTREEALGFGIMSDFSEALVGAVIGDKKIPQDALKRAERRVKTFNEATKQ